jgi:hypothetical protein
MRVCGRAFLFISFSGGALRENAGRFQGLS